MVAHSNGAYAARELYRLAPNRVCAMVLLEGSFRQPTPDLGMIRALVDGLQARPWPQALMQTNAAPGASAETLERLALMHRRVSQQAAIESANALLDPNLYGEDRVNVPVLLVIGPGPAWTEEHLAWMQSVAPQLQTRRLANVSHYLIWDKPDEVNRIIEHAGRIDARRNLTLAVPR